MTLDGKKLIEDSLQVVTALRGTAPTVSLERGNVAGMPVLVAHVNWGEPTFCGNMPVDCVRVTITPRSATMDGDYGTYVFAKNIRDPFTFFVGRNPDFFYWSEKIESAPRWYWDKEVDGELLRQNLQEALDARFSPGEFDADSLPDADRYTPESWYDVISAEAERNEWGLDSEEIGGIVSASTKPDKCFVSVCYILQYVENLAKYGGDNG